MIHRDPIIADVAATHKRGHVERDVYKLACVRVPENFLQVMSVRKANYID